MIPGTLRPLPKKVKEVKSEADVLLKTVNHDLQTTGEMLKNSTLYTFEEINYHYIRINEHLVKVIPLVREAEKIATKYFNDYLLNKLVFNLFSDLETAESRLQGDSQRLDTILMSKRKKHIEETIPTIKKEIRSKLSFLKGLSLDEILAKSQAYEETISEIVGKLGALRDEYQKLSSGSFDVSEFYGYLNEKLEEVENELGEYELILRTCRMQILAEEAEKLVEEGNVVSNEFEIDKSSEQILKTDNYASKAGLKLEEMNNLRVSLPRRGITKEFSKKFKELQQQFEINKTSLFSIKEGLQERLVLFEKKISWINAIRTIADSEGEDIHETYKLIKSKGDVFNLKLMTIKEKDIHLKSSIKLKGTLKLALLEGNFPVFELSPLGLVKLPLGEELSTEKIEQILATLDEIEKTVFADEMRNRRTANKILKEREQKVSAFSTVKERLTPAYNKTKEVTVSGAKRTQAFFKNLFSREKETKDLHETKIDEEQDIQETPKE
ncbi:MAG: hypothetical protein HGN29_09165 [Asgard group archaeon]|nr:hypothetical protein [Asgard group archaeon]